MFYLVTGGFHSQFISYWPQIVVHRFVIFVLLQKHNPTLFFLFFFFPFSSLCWVSSFHLKFFPGYLKQTLTTSDPVFWLLYRVMEHQSASSANSPLQSVCRNTLRPTLPRECRKLFHRCFFFCFLLFTNSKNI